MSRQARSLSGRTRSLKREREKPRQVRGFFRARGCHPPLVEVASLRVAHDGHDHIGIIFDDEIESPVTVHASLPQIFRLVVFLRMQGRMMEIDGEETGLLIKGLLDLGVGFPIVPS